MASLDLLNNVKKYGKKFLKSGHYLQGHAVHKGQHFFLLNVCFMGIKGSIILRIFKKYTFTLVTKCS
jgi:hypothetical protein